MKLKVYGLILILMGQLPCAFAMNKAQVQQTGLVEKGVLVATAAVVTGIGYLYNTYQIRQKKLRFQAQKKQKEAEKEQVFEPREKVVTDLGDEIIFTPPGVHDAIILEEQSILQELSYENKVDRHELSQILLDYYLQDRMVKSSFEIAYKEYKIAVKHAKKFNFSRFSQQDCQCFERLKQKISDEMGNALKKQKFGFIEYQKKDEQALSDLLNQYYAKNDFGQRDQFKVIMDHSRVLLFKAWGQVFGCFVWHTKGLHHTIYCLRDRVANKYMGMESFEIIHNEMTQALADIIDYCFTQEHEVLLGRYGW